MLTGHLWRALAHAALMLMVAVPSAIAAPDLDAATRNARLASDETHCHDLGPATLTCFATEVNRDADAEALLVGETLLASSSGYVVAYVQPSFGGSSVFLTQDYGHLGHIGWDDKISSYKVYTSYTGYWFEHIWYSGRAQSYCCFTQVPYVGDALNNRISSFDLP